MKALRKIKLQGELDVLNDEELKMVIGGAIFECTRISSTGETAYFYTNATMAGPWCDFWKSAGWYVDCPSPQRVPPGCRYI